MVNFRFLKYVLIAVSALFLLINILMGLLDYYKLEKSHKYTICTLNEINIIRSGVKIFYDYRINGKTYKNSEIVEDLRYSTLKKNYLHRKFLLKYQPSNPENCKIMLDYRIKKGAKAPPDGWDEIPLKK